MDLEGNIFDLNGNFVATMDDGDGDGGDGESSQQ